MTHQTPNLIPLALVGQTLYSYPVCQLNRLNGSMPGKRVDDMTTYTVTDSAIRARIKKSLATKRRPGREPHIVFTYTDDFVLDGVELDTTVSLTEPQYLWIEHLRTVHLSDNGCPFTS